MSNLAELRQNLEQYETQMEQVKSLLLLDPHNEQYLKLQQDLNDATKLTEQIILQTQAENSTIPEGSLQLRKGNWIPRVGDRVEAQWAEKTYPAVILSLEGSEGEQTLTLRYYGYTNVDTKSREEVMPLMEANCLEPALATVGYTCEAKWVGDGEWYDARIEGIVENGYKVKFSAYGNETEVPIEYLRVKQAGASAVSGKKRKGSEGPKDFIIPDHLRLLPGDSEEEKGKKRKKVKHLKLLWKNKQVQEEDEGATSWQSYLSKSRKPKGLGKLRKESIFASPDSVEGRVGVVGSGKGITAFDSRQKFTPKQR